MQSRAILVSLDGSQLAERALGPAGQLARGIGAALVLVRVVPERAPEERALQAAEVEAAERYLYVVADRLREKGAVVLAEAVAGEPAEAILAQATLWRAELIAIATHGRGGLGRLLHGSVADAVVRGARVPVLLIPARGHVEPTLHGDAIVVAVDGSVFAETALARAAEIARELAMPLVVVQSIGWEPTPIEGLAPTFVRLDELKAHVRAYLDTLVGRVRRAGVDARARVAVGPAARTILEVAEAENAALVVMATHGRTALTRLTMGSVATEVLTHTRRPVLFLRPELAPGEAPVLDVPVARGAGATAVPFAGGPA
jgi:nucleotide-binding universal stress UspA family protein